ncbi:hypothetical protein VWY69_00380 [Phaeobacter sp. A90a-4k]|uniref:hypothetical protein n=1 Tax=unclassified Phaeobacter TaxID=2621772 RepID=UPI003A865F91
MKKFIFLALLGVAGCATTTPLPDVRGSVVRPLNPTLWEYQEALRRKQAEIGVKGSGATNASQ